MEECGGTLVVHLDTSAAACTEELEGRCCPGPHAAHRGGWVSCEEALGPDGCEFCAFEIPALEEWTDRDWRHVAHLGQLAQRPRRCLAHARRRWLVSVTSEIRP